MITIDMPNNAAARKVLAEFKTIVRSKHRSKRKSVSVRVEHYCNCREQGYSLSLWVGKRKVSFSENRNSDNIVVYFGNPSDFAFNTNIPSEDVWQNAKYFRYDEQLQAARFIYKYLFLGETS